MSDEQQCGCGYPDENESNDEHANQHVTWLKDLEADLEALEAADPEVKAAADRLGDVTRDIIARARRDRTS